MYFNVYTISILFSIFFVVLVLELVRKKYLLERYSLIWIVTSIILLILSSSPSIINFVAKILKIENPPSFLFLFGLVFLIIYNLHMTIVLSKQSEKLVRLAQEMGILNAKDT